MTRLRFLVLADDRTGASETAGALAALDAPVPVVPYGCEVPDAPEIVVVDLGSRHLDPPDAAARAAKVASAASDRRILVKLDSTLRGNWAAEANAAYPSWASLLVVAGFPAVERVCRDGTVLDHGVPVAEGPAGRDPRRPVTSSRPIEHLAAAGRWEVEVLDVVVDDDLVAAGRRWVDESSTGFVGTAAAIGAAVRAAIGARHAAPMPSREAPALVAIGSAHPAARAQLQALLDAGWSSTAGGDRTALATPDLHDGTGDEQAALALAAEVGRALARRPVNTLVVVGGDTAAAILGDETVSVGGLCAPGIPWARRVDGTLLITKPGGFGGPDAVLRLFDPA